MPNKFIAMLTVKRLLIFLQRGLPIRSIAAELAIGANTVAAYKKLIEKRNKTLEELLAMEDIALAAIMRANEGKRKTNIRLEDFKKNLEYYQCELAARRASRILLFEESRNQYPDGYKYSKFCDLLCEAMAVKNATYHHVYTPGDKLMFDFAGRKMHYVIKETGEIIEVPVFIAVCPYSCFAYAETLENASLPQVVKALNNCLEYLG